MTIYEHIYYFFDSIFNNDTPMFWDTNFIIGESWNVSFGEWLSHTFTIISIALIFIFLIIFIKWLFKLFGGLFKW